MRRIILTEKTHIHPFNEPARDLRVQNKPLWLWQRDLLTPYTTEEREYPDWQTAYRFEEDTVESLVHRDNLFFNQELIAEFIERARNGRRPVRLAFSVDDPAIAAHVLPLTHSFFHKDNLVLTDLWYLPKGLSQSVEAEPLVINTEALERGYYLVPPYMASEFGDLVYQLPRKAFVLIENWVHVFVADILFGVFARGAFFENSIGADWKLKLKILYRSLLEQKHVLSNSEMVKIGKNVSIDSSAVIHGPTVIGDNVNIGAGAVIDNCTIGSNVTVSQGCQLMLSVISDGCFLPFRTSLFMTTMMDNSMVAQNSCLQLCVIGRDSFVGAGTTFTDFNILGGPLRTVNKKDGPLEHANMLVLGGCVGHHCRLSSGLVVYAARTIESDVVLLATDERSFITKNVSFEESDHYVYEGRYPYWREYPRADED
jgi:UDP-N-acetylglucosamine diphosphorylase / glucose-1-phosphate thymidylyltransferase / UDP-N-acetylgalactosamine diphosphorylase / glucosamine-1-phosphate N-acetyltransferase / galactosamine-1-phosphate N-acetyltransferase